MLIYLNVLLVALNTKMPRIILHEVVTRFTENLIYSISS